MIPACERQNQTIRSTQSIRLVVPLTQQSFGTNVNAPLTRSRARILSTINKNDENSQVSVIRPTRNLRSRGHLKENQAKMNVLKDKTVNRKRKFGDVEDDRERKTIKLDAKPPKRMGPPLRTLASIDSLQMQQTKIGLAISSDSTLLWAHGTAPPTPAREILRQGMLKNKVSQDGIQEMKSQKELSVQSPTPLVLHQNEGTVVEEDGSMESFLSGFVARPPTPPKKHQTDTNPITEPSAFLPKPSTLLIKPTEWVAATQLGSSSQLATASEEKAKTSILPSTPAVAATKPKITSPLSNRRIAVAARKAWEGISLDALVLTASPNKEKQVQGMPSLGKSVESLNKNVSTIVQSKHNENTLNVEDVIVDAQSRQKTWKQIQKTSINQDLLPANSDTEITLAAIPLDMPTPSLTTLEPQSHTSTAVKTLGVMGPNSRIPISTRPSQPALSISRADKSTSSLFSVKSKAVRPGAPSLPERRPASRPAMVNGNASVPIEGPSSSSNKRQASYPSSLGSGPLIHPTARVVSNPMGFSPASGTKISVPSHTSASNSQNQRSVSAPAARPRTSISRREGMSAETSQSLAGLSHALEKLKAKKRLSSSSTSPSSEPPCSTIPPSDPIVASAAHIQEDSSRNFSVFTSAKMRRKSAIVGDTSMTKVADNMSLSDMLNSKDAVQVFAGVVAFVDVRTSDGAVGASVFIDILRGAGARVLSRPASSCTHIIYKSGRLSTQNWYRRQESLKPKLVGIKWVIDSKKAGKKLEEENYLVDLSHESVFNVVHHRKSVEPKSLIGQGEVMMSSIKKTSLLAIAEARRKSMAYAPKLPSPLKKAHLNLSSDNP
ncbi:uncharacterized protein L203_102529 [Cryptococcus depauperatus CBS 7841]|uniref:Uncharacterized protein n=1 Tax=Cryptococcus depauperatus CBS 7841 TaxID=1295531 RepID=A0A1E3IFY4_9TREE|nr:hypothetical protein L203_03888 [Cryptococcus depauperatus CBS 7841]